MIKAAIASIKNPETKKMAKIVAISKTGGKSTKYTCKKAGMRLTEIKFPKVTPQQ
jgi:hypothetical protein